MYSLHGVPIYSAIVHNNLYIHILFTNLTPLCHICWMVCSLTVTYDRFPVILGKSWWVPNVGQKMLTLPGTHDFTRFGEFMIHPFVKYTLDITELVSFRTMFMDLFAWISLTFFFTDLFYYIYMHSTKHSRALTHAYVLYFIILICICISNGMLYDIWSLYLTWPPKTWAIWRIL